MLEGALGALAWVGFVHSIQSTRAQTGVSSVTAGAQLVPRNPRKMNPSVFGNELVCCACMLKLTWQRGLSWRAAVDFTMADRAAVTAHSLVHTALIVHLHLLKPLPDQLLSSLTPAWNCSALPDSSCFCEVLVSWHLVAPWHPLLYLTVPAWPAAFPVLALSKRAGNSESSQHLLADQGSRISFSQLTWEQALI